MGVGRDGGGGGGKGWRVVGRRVDGKFRSWMQICGSVTKKSCRAKKEVIAMLMGKAGGET